MERLPFALQTAHVDLFDKARKDLIRPHDMADYWPGAGV